MMDGTERIYCDFTCELFFSPDDRCFTYEHFTGWMLEQKLRLMDEGYIHFLILTPKHRLPDCWFIQAMKRESGFLFEVSKNEGGKNRLYARDNTSLSELERYFSDFLSEERVPDVTDWRFVGEFRSPDEIE